MMFRYISLEAESTANPPVIYNPSMVDGVLVFDENTRIGKRNTGGESDKLIVHIGEDGTAKLLFVKFTMISRNHVDEADTTNEINFKSYKVLREMVRLISKTIESHEKREP